MNGLKRPRSPGDLIGAYNFGVCLARVWGYRGMTRGRHFWLRRAAEGVVNAQYWYGRMLLEGRGMPANPEEAAIWLKRAADLNMTDALVTLAEDDDQWPGRATGP